MLGHQKVELAVTYPMLPGAGAAHAKRPHDHTLMQFVRFFAFSGIILANQKTKMKITIADMANDWGK